MESPITSNDNTLFEFENNMFEGAQGFRIPRDGVYNITIAGAAGGRGVCNLHNGQGVVHEFQLLLSTNHELLILVGQRGVGPCDTNPTHSLCGNPPTNVNSASICNESWYNWTSTLESPLGEIVYNSNGGAGGGGASMIWARNVENRTFTGQSLFISAGGGGSAAVLNYSASIVIATAYEGLAGITLTMSNEQLYQYHLNGRSFSDPRTYVFMGERGYRPSVPTGLTFTAGAGGGYRNLLSQPSDIDGKSVGEFDNFAVGGEFCAEQVLRESMDSNIFLETFGGFGGGGGGCGGGGGGGGYTGGAVFGTTNDIPGGGGHSMAGNLSAIASTIAYYNNLGEGYVDIIPADCGCTGECVVDHNTDLFECLCSVNSTLAPDGSDCFREFIVDVEVNGTSTTDEQGVMLTIKEVYFTEVSVFIFSIFSELGFSRDASRCAVVFLDRNQRPILVSNVARPENPQVNSLAMVTFIGDTEVITLSNYSNFLRSPLLVTGAVLVSVGDCFIVNNMITLNTSTRAINEGPSRNFQDIQSLLEGSNGERVLQIGLPSGSASSTGIVAGIVLIMLGVIMITVFTVLIVAVLLYVRKVKRTGHNPKFMKRVSSITLRPVDSIGRTSYSIEDEKPLTTTEETIQMKKELPVISSQHLTLDKTIGEGEFGRVCKAKLTNTRDNIGLTVAVKTLKGFFDQQQADDLLQESKKMGGFDHPNVLGLIGICLDGGPAPFLVMPFMEKGSLLSYLRKNKGSLIITDQQETDPSMISKVTVRLSDMCLQIAKGMEYLANKNIIHRDLAARNCMMDLKNHIKVSDFGLSESTYTKTYIKQENHTTVPLPVKWIAPESYNFGKFSEKTDVWAFGVTCWEVFSGGKIPYPGVPSLSVPKLLEEGHRMEKPKNNACTEQMYCMINKCWKADDEERPTFSEIVNVISDDMSALADYLPLSPLSEHSMVIPDTQESMALHECSQV